jgi:hypothetical protein
VVILAVAVVIVGVLCLTNLLLAFGVIRRLREHTAALSDQSNGHPSVTGLATGEKPAPFAVTTTDEQLRTGPAGLRLVAFFSTSCSLCPKRVPVFADYVRANRVQRGDVLAVVLGGHGEPVPYLDELTAVAQVRLEAEGSELAMAFKVSGYPAFCLLDADGAVLASGYDPDALPAPVPA